MALIAGSLRFDGDPDPVLDPGTVAAGDRNRWASLSTPGAGLLHPGQARDWVAVDGDLAGGEGAAVARGWDEPDFAALRRLVGSWALARWEPGAQVLWLARDPFGGRPLFWARSGARLAFASSIPALTGLSWVSREPALDHLAEYLSFRYLHAPATLLRDVFEVPPGHVVRLDAGGTRLARWFDPGWCRPGTHGPDASEAAQAVDQALRRSVQRLLPHGEPVATLLSGGLDSSAILYHARELQPDIAACTVAVADDPAAESPFAARAATVLGARHEVVRISDQDLVAAVDRATAAMGQPLPSPAAVIQLLFFEHLRAHRRVLLGGDGGDEVLGGRGIEAIARRMRGSRVVSRVPRPTRDLVRLLARRAGLRDLAVAPDHFGADRLIGGSRVFKSHERIQVLRDIGLVRPGIRRTVLEPLYQEVDTDPLNQILHVWQRGWLPQDSLARAERMATAAGVEVRYPLLDAELVALCNGWPAAVKLRRMGARTETKAPLRLAMQGRLPDRLLRRPKRSLPAPLDRWLRTGGIGFLRDRVQRLLDDGSGTWSPNGVQALLDEHLDRRANHGLKLWTLILYQAWRDRL
ncbi:asparagine synthetase B [Myxococcota bacterium]|nr:asparagine synthetase B [Myxococcota bacterium]